MKTMKYEILLDGEVVLTFKEIKDIPRIYIDNIEIFTIRSVRRTNKDKFDALDALFNI
jgi:uncharacterized protein YkuJ